MSLLSYGVFNLSKNAFFKVRSTNIHFSKFQINLSTMKTTSPERRYSILSKNVENSNKSEISKTLFPTQQNKDGKKCQQKQSTFIQTRKISTSNQFFQENDSKSTLQTQTQPIQNADKPIKTISIKNIDQIPATIRHKFPGNPIDSSKLTLERMLKK